MYESGIGHTFIGIQRPVAAGLADRINMIKG